MIIDLLYQNQNAKSRIFVNKHHKKIKRLTFLLVERLKADKNNDPNHLQIRITIGSPSWTRTNDPAVNSRMLYRLSY